MDYNNLKTHNYELFLDGVSTGNIAVGEIGGNLAVGNPQPSPMITGFVGGPYFPVANKLPKNLAGMTYGSTGNYSRPYLSVNQYFNNGVYNYVGVYAKLVRYKKPLTSTCITEKCGDDQFVKQEIWGRVGTIMSGAYSGQLGFYAQDWYNVNDGPYDAAFWSNNNNPPINPPIPDKQKWWDQCTKATVRVRFQNDPLREFADVEVALDNLSSTSDEYFNADDLTSLQDGSLQLLPIFAQIITGLGVWI
tara:strand:- start:306 stop:1049 length:744 start_codon:yes stop_codon:yes gene_type:complete